MGYHLSLTGEPVNSVGKQFEHLVQTFLAKPYVGSWCDLAESYPRLGTAELLTFPGSHFEVHWGTSLAA